MAFIGFSQDTLEDRERVFKEAVRRHNHTVRLPEQDLEKFFDYWLQVTANGKEFLFERTKRKTAFDIPRRMKKFMPKGNLPEQKTSFPNYPDRKFLRSCFGKQWGDYKKHLEALGWEYRQSAGGSSFQKKGEPIVWL